MDVMAQGRSRRRRPPSTNGGGAATVIEVTVAVLTAAALVLCWYGKGKGGEESGYCGGSGRHTDRGGDGCRCDAKWATAVLENIEQRLRLSRRRRLRWL